NTVTMVDVYGRNTDASSNEVCVSRYSDPLITGETAAKMNLALEMSLWNKWNFVGEFFRQHRTNILQDRVSTPASMGLWQTPSANIGEATGKGVDMSLDYNQSFASGAWL